MNAPIENIDGRSRLAGKATKALAFAGALAAFEAQAATVVDQSFAPTITAVSTDPNVDEVTPSALGSDVYVGVYPDWDESIVAHSGIYKVLTPSSIVPVSGLENYGFVVPLSQTQLLGAFPHGSPGFDQADFFGGSWASSDYAEPFDALGTNFSDSHPGFARTPNGDVIVGSHNVPRALDSIQLHENGVSRELVLTETLGGFTLDIDRREMYFGDYSDLENPSIWVTSLDTWAPRLVVEGAFEPYFDATTQKLYFSTDVDPADTTNYDVLSIQKLPEVAPELPVVEPESVLGQDGTDLSRDTAEIDCTEVPTYTIRVALPGGVTAYEGLVLVEGDIQTPLAGRIEGEDLLVDVPTVGMPIGALCRVLGTAVNATSQAPFEAALVAIPSCEVSLEDEEVQHVDTAPADGEVLIDGTAGTLEYTVDFLAKFADGGVTADVKGAGTLVYGVDESGRSFLRSSDGIIRFLSGTDARMVKFAPTEGSVTIFGADGRALITLNAGEIAVVSIDYVTPEEVENPGTDTEDPETEKPESIGCDVTGENPKDLRGRFGAMLLVAAGFLRRKKN